MHFFASTAHRNMSDDTTNQSEKIITYSVPLHGLCRDFQRNNILRMHTVVTTTEKEAARITYASSWRLGRHCRRHRGKKSQDARGQHGDAASTPNSVGYRTLAADYYITSHAQLNRCSAAAFPASPSPIPSLSVSHFHRWQRIGETGDTERTTSSPRGLGACHDDVCVRGPDGSCCSRLCTNVVDSDARRRIAKRHRRRRNLTEEKVTSAGDMTVPICGIIAKPGARGQQRNNSLLSLSSRFRLCV